MEWQSIETAPGKVDNLYYGPEVLLYDPEVGVDIGHFIGRRGRWEVVEGIYWSPTHWMPLPDPPNKEG